MKCPKIILLLGYVILSHLAHAQLELGEFYDTSFLKKTYTHAIAQKDSALLGDAAYLLSGHLEWHDGTTSRIVDLVALSVKCYAAVGDSLKYYMTRSNLAEYYMDSKLYSEAEKINLEAKEFYHRQKDMVMEVHMSTRLARLYKIMGDSLNHQFYYKESQVLNKIVGDTLLQIIFLIDDAQLYHAQERWDSSLLVAHQSLVLSKAIDRSKFMALSQYQIGLVAFEQGHLDSAIYYFKLAEITDRPIEYSGIRKDCLLRLSECFKQKNDFEIALEYSNRYVNLNDSILNKDRIEALDEMALTYESKEKEATITLLEGQKTLIEHQNHQKSFFLWGLALALFLLFILLWFVIRFYKEKIKRDEIIAGQAQKLSNQKIKLMEDNLQLTAIKSMLEGQEKERSRIARDLHDSVGGLLSTIKIQLGKAPVDELGLLLNKTASEVRNISQNLQSSSLEQLGLLAALKDLVLLNMRSNQLPKISLQHYNFSKNLDKSTALQLYRITQEALHNALRHASATEILIQLNEEKQGLLLEIEDDGKGFDTNKAHTGEGLMNMQQRADFLQADLSVESSSKGTSIYLFLSYET